MSSAQTIAPKRTRPCKCSNKYINWNVLSKTHPGSGLLQQRGPFCLAWVDSCAAWWEKMSIECLDIRYKAFRYVETLFVQGNQVRIDQNKPLFYYQKRRFVLISTNLITLDELSFYMSKCLISFVPLIKDWFMKLLYFLDLSSSAYLSPIKITLALLFITGFWCCYGE